MEGTMRKLLHVIVYAALIGTLGAVVVPRLLPGGSAQAAHPPAAAALRKDISCNPIDVTVWVTSPRVHVRCASSIGGIQYFAVSTQNSGEAARVLSVLTAAQVAGRTLTISYDPADTSGTKIGCQANNCRLIEAVGFGK
jgi:hypothetical protein